jgi:preprotein translocase subunit SecA
LEIKALGGLYVLGTERHEARRIDNQLRGRAGRQGDEGETQFFVSMDDSLMRVFGGARVQGLMGTFKIPEDQPIEMGMISRTLESAQTKIEGFHFDSRKQVLAYDNVLNQQRQVIYVRRRKLLQADEQEIADVLQELYAAHPEAEGIIAAKKAEFGEEVFIDLFRRLLLQMTDMLWVEHLEVMGFTRSSVSLRAYGQRDPLIEYRKEGLRLFKEMQNVLLDRVAEVLPRVQPQEFAKEEAQRRETARAAQAAAGVSNANTAKKSAKQEPVQKEELYARNDMVTITDGTQTQELKYKKAQDLLANGWTVVEK